MVMSTRVGRTDLGPGTAVVDENAIIVVIRLASDERPVCVPLAGIDEIAIDIHELTLLLHDGARVALVMDSAKEFRDEIEARCRAIPELTRALRAFGSRRGQRRWRPGGAAEQQQFFAPLLNGRREALASASTSPTIAFDSETITRAVEATLQSFAVARYGGNAPARRALEAELVDLAEPLRVALEALHLAAATIHSAPNDLRLWRLWSSRLRATFEAADRVWLSLDAALDAASEDP